jgi:large subunit ribosomal protein L2
MGKRILVQRRGRGSQTFRAPTHKRVAPAKYPSSIGLAGTEEAKGFVKGFLHDPGRGAPLAMIELSNGEEFCTVAPEGLYKGAEVSLGPKASLDIGNVLPVGQIPEGTIICNLERLPGDGGRLIRSSGAYGIVLSHSGDETSIKMPSGKVIYVKNECRATVGVVAGGGRTDKPFLKAGKKLKLMEARGRKYPTVRGVAMIPVYHPHGGGRHQHPGKPTTIGRTAPPGRKVGLIAARRTGRGGKARKTKA